MVSIVSNTNPVVTYLVGFALVVVWGYVLYRGLREWLITPDPPTYTDEQRLLSDYPLELWARHKVR